jgi:phosphoribosylaminoimidazole-succinocarboxamide synthase
MKSQTQPSTPKAIDKVPMSPRREFIGTQGEKNIFHSDKPEYLVQEFTSKNTNGGSAASTGGLRSAIRNEISSYLFEYIEGFHIPTHFVSKLTGTEMLVRTTETVPLEVCVYNVSDKSFTERYGLPDGQLLDFPIIEHYFLNKEGTRLLANEYHFFALGVVSPEEFKQVNRIASKVNAVLRGLCDRRQLTLFHLKLYFGRSRGQLIVIDEISPSTCRITSKEHGRGHRGANHEQDETALVELRDRLLLKV